MNCGIIITIEILEINIKAIIAIAKEAHLGILQKSRILPVSVQSAMAITIDAKNSMNISFKLHKITIEINNAETDNKVVVFNLYI